MDKDAKGIQLTADQARRALVFSEAVVTAAFKEVLMNEPQNSTASFFDMRPTMGRSEPILTGGSAADCLAPQAPYKVGSPPQCSSDREGIPNLTIVIPPDVDQYAVIGFGDVHEWAMLNDVTWKKVNVTSRLGMQEIDVLRMLAVALLREKHGDLK